MRTGPQSSIGWEFVDTTLRPLPLGQLRPTGWLRDQLRLQADGMAGHLDEFWPDVARSAWIGGDAEGWERAPYWLDALIPLAAVLGDDRLAAKAHRWVDHLLTHQHADGWMSPAAGNDDVWPRMLVLKALLQYRSAYGDERTVPACLRLIRAIDARLARTPLYEWARVRWPDLVRGVHEVAALTGAGGLPEIAGRVRAQGYDWAEFAGRVPYRRKVDDAMLRQFQADAGGLWMNDRYLTSHGVNVAMGFRALEDSAQFHAMLDQLDAFHGQASGMFSADEHLAGRSPAQGTETCAVVEFLYSLATALESWGVDERLIQRWEEIAFNALPASARANECGHQYDQQANQVICHVTEERVYTNNGPDANIFGLAPHFGCCTANRHQGWPKFAARLWMRAADGGLSALSYAPCDIATEFDGAPVRIAVTGDYPFHDRVRIELTAHTAVPVRLRIPGWAQNATLAVDSGPHEPVAAGSVVELRREWSGEHLIELALPAGVVTRPRPNGAVSVHRGPIVFALAVAEDWRQIGGTEPYGDWAVHPAGEWNLSLRRDSLHAESRRLDGPVFAPDTTPLRLHGTATGVPQWTIRRGAAGDPPPSPCPGSGPERTVVLLPYGAARLRVTELPWH